jgi:hypothetical protein
MHSFRRFAFLLALVLPALYAVHAQSSSSSSDSATPAASAPAQDQAQQPAPQSQGQLSVQARIRARREQRRVAAIHDVYDHLYEGYVGAGFQRTHAGAPQKVNEYNWNGGFTRYYNERLGLTLDGRGYYGTQFVGVNFSGITKPAISQYDVLFGPTYRFYLQPKYSISARVMGGYAYGNFSGDANGFGSICPATGKCLLYPDGSSFAVSGSVFAEYNLAPSIGLRLAPEYFMSGYGSTIQNGLGLTAGIVYRFKKQ